MMTSRHVIMPLAAVLVVLACLLLVKSDWRRTHDVSKFSTRDAALQFPHTSTETQESSVPKYNFQRKPSNIPEVWHHELELDSSEEEIHSLQPSDDIFEGYGEYGLSQNSAAKSSHSMESTCTIINNTYCDCSSRRWTKIPDGLHNCTMLSMYDNKLVSIPSGTFLNYTTLQVLILEKNNISLLYNDSFQGLRHLYRLNLRNNSLPMTNGTFPDGVFEPLSSLRFLILSQNNENLTDDNLEYPDQAFSKLKNLTDLSMDGLNNKTFGDGFKHMTSLRSLSLAGYTTGNCLFEVITNTTFRNLEQLNVLNISDCSLQGELIETGAFAMLSNLVTLDVSWNGQLGFDDLVRVLRGWTNTTLNELRANYIVGRYAPSGHITGDQVASLPHTLKTLKVRGNSIETIGPDVFASLPKSLKHLDASENRFTFGCYLKNMSQMINLERLTLNGGRVTYVMPNTYPPCPVGGVPASKSSVYYDSDCRSGASGTMVLYLPPHLTSLNMHNAGLSYKFTELHVDEENMLESLKLDGNSFPTLEGPLYGLNNLKNLSISGCSVQWVSYVFFQNLTSLLHLDLSNNLIGLFLQPKGIIHMFSALSNLQFFNLSFNAFQNIVWQPHFFDGLNNLEELYLQNNRLWHFGFNISHMTKLRVLNLSDTSVSTLTEVIREDIQRLLTEFNTSIVVDMSQNPIGCTCENLDFLQWLSTSKAFNESLSTQVYSCAFPNSIFKNITDHYDEILENLHGECESKYLVFLVTLGCTLLLASVVLALITYRFRWKLRYLYYGAYLSIRKQRGNDGATREKFRSDVFVSYANADDDFVVQNILPELGSRGLKLHIHGRDFVTGNYIASNIVTAVKESRKTLVVLTRALLNSTWCNYELQMANMESVNSGRQVLVFLLKESIPNKDLGMELLYHIRNNTYITYPEPDADEQTVHNLIKAFWDKLANDLKA